MSAIPLHGPKTRALPRTRVIVERRKAMLDAALSYVAAFLFVVGVTYGASSLVGQTLLEQARRSGIRAREHALDARKDVAVLRQRVERLVSIRSVEEWARIRGYSLEGTPQPAQAKLAAKETKKWSGLRTKG